MREKRRFVVAAAAVVIAMSAFAAGKYAWRSPQLESSAFWEKDGLLWAAPWGEKVKFFPKAEKTPKDAIKIDVIEEAKKDS